MKMKELLEEAGVWQFGVVDTADMKFEQEVREMCAANVCRQYNKSWACPPAVGSVEECRERVQQYEKFLLFSVKYDLEDSFDYEGMMAGGAAFKKTCREIDGKLRPLLGKYLMLSNEGCGLCQECTYPDAPCRFPDRAHGSLEGYGIFVNQLAKQAGMKYINGANTVTYFGGIAFHPEDLAAMENEA